MVSELALCRRELAYQEALLASVQERLELDSERREQELCELRAELYRLAESASACCAEGIREDLELQRSLAASRGQLQQMSSELLAAQAQASHLAEAAKLASSWQAVRSRRKRDLEERQELEARVLMMQRDLRGMHERKEFLETKTSSMEASLQLEQRTLEQYETGSHDLRQELMTAFYQLQVSHEGAVQEQRRLQEHVASLEGQLPERHFMARQLLLGSMPQSAAAVELQQDQIPWLEKHQLPRSPHGTGPDVPAHPELPRAFQLAEPVRPQRQWPARPAEPVTPLRPVGQVSPSAESARFGRAEELFETEPRIPIYQDDDLQTQKLEVRPRGVRTSGSSVGFEGALLLAEGAFGRGLSTNCTEGEFLGK
eukprot:TRINITY_DN43008_c0_g1_i1.p1 TRINITY_DN43008_c0_g1~~TRINITY_DN43008_c0_g1_i1.p1  ORF type:complete len:383 (+),score=91.45 TRINITY_DN43008_c0_g1_i1:38-1150(+)